MESLGPRATRWQPDNLGRASPSPGAASRWSQLENSLASGWRILRTLADTDPRLDPARLDPARLDELISRARRQADELEDLRVAAVGRVVRACPS